MSISDGAAWEKEFGWQETKVGRLFSKEPNLKTFNRELIERGAELILIGLGVDVKDHNFADTPKRVADVYQEMFCPPETGWPMFEEDFTDIVVLRHHTFYTMCPHHLLPVKIVANVAYIPSGKVMGASKLARVIHDINTMPLTQEALMDRVINRMRDLLGDHSKGEAISLIGEHGCFAIRGVKSGADMATLKLTGAFKEPEWEKKFYHLVSYR